MRGGEVLIADDPIAFGFTKSKDRDPSQRLRGSCPHSLEDLDGVSPSPLPGPEPSNKQKQQRSFDISFSGVERAGWNVTSPRVLEFTVWFWGWDKGLYYDYSMTPGVHHCKPSTNLGKIMCRNAHGALRRQTPRAMVPLDFPNVGFQSGLPKVKLHNLTPVQPANQP